MNDSSEIPYRSVCLVGFMAAGKSAVGRSLARRLEWDFIDLDEWIEGMAGRTIPEIFQVDGESAFREMEAIAGAEVLAGSARVVATGGGWGAAPGRIEALPRDVLSVWLQVSPELAVIRAGRQAPGRPMLAGAGSPAPRAAALLAEREPLYRTAALHIDTEDRSIDAVVEEILRKLRSESDSDLHE